ncbi:MAG: phosphate ABC transporter substrate-binding protein [Candidatus Riflebacteria bacterium]|nr:phosphate ABC transporter substrate-binding protein [Candidatus Riflebacteria bacterium]
MKNKPDSLIWWKTFFLISLCFSLMLSGCGASGHGLVIAGSTSVQPLIEKISESYRKKNPNTRILVEGGGSSAGISAVILGTAHLGMSSRDLKKNDPRESTLEKIVIAYDAIAVIVNPENPIKNISIENLRNLFSGKIKNWKEIGGNDRNINLIVREEGSGTRTAFEEMVMRISKTEELSIDSFALVQDSTGGVQEVVRCDPGSIGFVSMGTVRNTVKALSIDDVKPEIQNVREKKYRLVRNFLFIKSGKLASETQEFVNYVLSNEGKSIMSREGLVEASE